MWNEEKVKGYGFSNYGLKNFTQRNLKFIPKISDLLDLLEDPRKIPCLYTPPAKETYLIETLSPETASDELTVKNFRQGLTEVTEISEKLIESYMHETAQKKDRIKINISLENLIGKISPDNVGNWFLWLSIGHLGKNYGLQFIVGDKNTYNAMTGNGESKFAEKFAETMRRNIGPNLMAKEIYS